MSRYRQRNDLVQRAIATDDHAAFDQTTRAAGDVTVGLVLFHGPYRTRILIGNV